MNREIMKKGSQLVERIVALHNYEIQKIIAACESVEEVRAATIATAAATIRELASSMHRVSDAGMVDIKLVGTILAASISRLPLEETLGENS
jgi:hypothetical protein